MEAWGDLKDWIDWQINNYKEILVNEADTDKIRRLQEAVKSFRSVLSFVTIKGLEGDLLQQQMQNQDPLTGLIQGDKNE